MPDQPGPELRLTIGRLARRIRSERARDDITDGQTAVLFALTLNGALTLGELSEHERVTPPSMNRTVNALEAAALVTRRGSPDDGRKVLIELTDAGHELIDEIRRRRDAWFARRLASLTTEERDILRSAEPILRQLADQ